MQEGILRYVIRQRLPGYTAERMNTTEAFVQTTNASVCEKNHAQEISTVVFVAATIQGIIAGLGILGNALVVFVLIMARDRQESSSVLYVLNLAIADFLFLVNVPFMIAQDITLQWHSGDFICKCTGFLMYLNFFVSPLFLMVMSIDRYLAVNRAVSSTELRARRSSRYVSITVWSIAVITVLPIAFFHSTVRHRCEPRFPGSPTPSLAPDVTACELMKLYQDCVDGYMFNYTDRSFSEKAQMTTNLHRNVAESEAQRNEQYVGRQSPEYAIIGSVEALRNFHEEATPTAMMLETLLPTLHRTSGVLPNTVVNQPILTRPLNPRVSSIGGRAALSTVGSSADKKMQELHEEAEDFCFVTLIGIPKEDESKIRCHFLGQPKSFHVWVVISFFYSYLIPCSVIFACYMAILRKLYRPSEMLNDHSNGRVRRQTMKKKVTLMVALLVLSYTICFTPYYLWQVIQVPGVTVSGSWVCSDVQRFTLTMAYLNSAINPLLYTFLGEQFRPKIRLAFRRAARSTASYRIRRTFVSRRKISSMGTRRKARMRDEVVAADTVGNGNENEENKMEENTRSLLTKDDIQRQRVRKSFPQDDRKKNGSFVLSCVKSSAREEECPHCIMEMARLKVNKNDVVVKTGNEEAERDESFSDQSRELQAMSKTGEEVAMHAHRSSAKNDDSDHETAEEESPNSVSGGKLCKRHRKSSKEPSERRFFKGKLANRRGFWGPATRLRSTTNIETEVSVYPA